MSIQKHADCTLKLGLIKRNILPKRCSQHHQIKIVNSEEYDEQLNHTRYSIKNVLFEITKKFKEFKFQ